MATTTHGGGDVPRSRLTREERELIKQQLTELAAETIDEATRTVTIKDAEASAIITELLKKPRHTWLSTLRSDVAYWSPAHARALLAAADAAYFDDVMRYADLTAASTALCEAVDRVAPAGTPDLVATAWKERATSFRLLGEFAAALHAVDIAYAAADRCTADHDCEVAIVKFAHALILSAMQDWNGALTLLHGAREVFAEADRRRYYDTLRHEADIENIRGNSVVAAEIYLSLHEVTLRSGDQRAIADLYTNLAFAMARAGETDFAHEFHAKAARLHVLLGMPTETARDEWLLARIQIASGEIDNGVDRLERVRVRFIELHRPVLAIQVGLELLEHDIRRGLDPEPVYQRCRRLAADARRLHLPVTHVMAVTYLRDLAGAVTFEAIDYVRNYLKRVEAYPNSAFLPPAAN